MTGTNSIRETFFQECEELLEALFEGLADIEAGVSEDETINAIFRAVHSIKGGAGAFGLDPLVQFAHKYETVFDAVRSHTLEISPDVLGVLQRAGDQLSDHVEAARDERTLNEGADAAVLSALGDLLGGDDADDEPEGEFVFDAVGIGFDPIVVDDAPVSTGGGYKIKFTPTAAMFLNGHDPKAIFALLREVGDLEITLDHSSIPPLAQFSLEEAYLSWDLNLTSEASEAKVRDAFEFVEGLCAIEISEVEADGSAGAPPLSIDPPASNVAEEIVKPAPTPTAEVAKAPAPIAPTPIAPAESKKDKSASSPKATLRVDLERVDRLINTAGELIINQAMMAQHIEELSLPRGSAIAVDLESFKQLAREIQEGVMSIRAQPVKPLFQRMARIVRETCDISSKQAKLVTEGEMTEVDKTVVERLADPLTHMIRNAVDHGLEDPQTRLDAGKSEVGMVRLTAAHRSGSVMIEIADDGGGLNRPKIRDIAIKKGLIPADAELSESEIDNLLFMPGFSTAETVSNLSGRGVGMDVVKNAISALGGRVTIQSVPGEGTTFSISLPLTLAVLDGMVIKLADETMVVPIASILETIRPMPNDLQKLAADGDLLSIRGTYVPIVDVAERLGLRSRRERFDDMVLLLVETETGGECALAVDDIADQRQIVIKGLQDNYGQISGIAAATILGNGKIALILDTDALAASNQDRSVEISNVRNRKEQLDVAEAR